MSTAEKSARRVRRASILAVAAMVLAACDTGSSAVPDGGGWFGAGDQQAVEADGSLASIVPELTAKARLDRAPAGELHVVYAPSTPPAITRTSQAIVEVHLEVVEDVCAIDPANDVTTIVWGFRIAGDAQVTCGAPGPVVRARVGDVLRMTVTNLAENEHAHNIDFHAVTGQGGGAEALIVAPGESATIDSRMLYPGAFMYHCAFGDVPEHIAKGMYGMIIVDPETPLPAADHEWAVMQSEWYVGAPDAEGFAAFDPVSLRVEEPRFVTFNGRTDALLGGNALTMAVGERGRIHFVNEGLNLASNFHPIGSQWDAVWPEGATHPSNRVIRGSQTTLVVAGGGTVVDLVAHVPSTVLLVDHALVRTFYKGALGQVVITGDAQPELFEVLSSPDTPAPEGGEPTEAASVEPNAVTIPAGAYDPANAATAYSPRSLTVEVGTTITWTNDDILPHTVTSDDGLFDSGNIEPGATWSQTFEEAGTFSYFCTPHPWMIGQVVVQ